MNPKSKIQNLKSIIFIVAFVTIGFYFFAGPGVNGADAFTCSSATSTEILPWSETTSWLDCNGTTPQPGDDVVILNATRLSADVTATVATITINGGSATSTIILSGNITLQATGAVTVGTPTVNNIPKTIDIGASGNVFQAGSLTIVGGSNPNQIAKVTASTGTITVDDGILNTGNNLNGVLETTGAATVNLAGTISQSSAAAVAFSINSATMVNFTATAAINGVYTLPITNVNAGTLTIGAATVFTGAVTVVSDAAWLNGANAVEFRNGFINNSGGTLTMGTGTHTFSTNAQAIDGTNSITFGGVVSIANGTVVTNNNDATVTISGD